MIIQPTTGQRSGAKLFLSIGVRTPDGRTPTEYFRGTSVGVGGRYTVDRLGLGEDKVRAATRNELRRLDRINIARMLEQFPDATVYVRRSRQV